VLQILLVPINQTDQKDDIVERLVAFLTLFACETARANRDFFDFFIEEYLLELAGVQQKSVRVRSCQLIAAILTSCQQSEELQFEYEMNGWR
jgi:hypothetical protein